MSDDKISLEFLGEQMLRMRADIRGLTSGHMKLESEQATLQAELIGVRADVRRVETKLDNFMASVDARFDQVNQTSATNLAITLEAIKGLDRKIENQE
jgi:hypothetical protein